MSLLEVCSCGNGLDRGDQEPSVAGYTALETWLVIRPRGGRDYAGRLGSAAARKAGFAENQSLVFSCYVIKTFEP